MSTVEIVVGAMIPKSRVHLKIFLLHVKNNPQMLVKPKHKAVIYLYHLYGPLVPLDDSACIVLQLLPSRSCYRETERAMWSVVLSSLGLAAVPGKVIYDSKAIIPFHTIED